MNYGQVIGRLGIARVCLGGCGLSENRHRTGTVDPFYGVHWSERRVTRRGLRRFLLAVAKRDRLLDPAFLNSPSLTYYHLYSDERYAAMLAGMLGVRFPAEFSKIERLRCIAAARKAKVSLSQRPAIYNWASRGLA